MSYSKLKYIYIYIYSEVLNSKRFRAESLMPVNLGE
jgi:hypothetical protein